MTGSARNPHALPGGRPRRLGGVVPALALTLWTLAAAGPLQAQEPAAQAPIPPLDAAQEEAVRALVRQTILDNPEILIEALQIYEQRKKEESEARAKENLVAKREELVNDPDSPVLGNPTGDVTIVEFFDYRCPYCKKVTDDLRKVLEEDGNVRFVLKEFPILGQESILAARAALAAHQQQRYEDMHFKLMDVVGEIDETTVFAVAELLGLDEAKLRQDMNSDEIEQAIRRNYSLAEDLEIGGTPAFVIGSKLFPGAIGLEELRKAIAEARAGAG